jgi:hypothetical protein
MAAGGSLALRELRLDLPAELRKSAGGEAGRNPLQNN